MIKENNKTCAIIGAGISGIGASIRMRNKGYKVTVYEANSFPGGKLSSETVNGYRFDLGPSVFTYPEFVDELFILSGKNPREYFNYEHLNPVYQYFFEDGSVLTSYHGREAYAAEMAAKTGESKEAILQYLDKNKTIYDLTTEVFMHNSSISLKTILPNA